MLDSCSRIQRPSSKRLAKSQSWKNNSEWYVPNIRSLVLMLTFALQANERVQELENGSCSKMGKASVK